MRIIVIGSNLASFSTAYHLAEIGYEVTVLDQSPIDSAYKNSPKGIANLYSRLFKRKKPTNLFSSSNVFTHTQDSKNVNLYSQTLRKRAEQLGVHIKNDCKVEKFIIQNNRIRGLCLTNKYNQKEIFIADKFVIAAEKNSLPTLRSLGINISFSEPTADFNQLTLGKTRYSNLFINLFNETINDDVLEHSGKILAEFIYNPDSETAQHYHLDTENTPHHLKPLSSRRSARIIN